MLEVTAKVWGNHVVSSEEEKRKAAVGGIWRKKGEWVMKN